MAAHSAMATVLVAESDPGLRHLFRLLLQQHYLVSEAPSATLATELLRSSPEPVIVLWDMWLSGTTGSHVLDMIEHDPAVRRHAFLLITPEFEAVSPTRRQQARRLQIPVIRMPFDVDLLLEQIAKSQQIASRRLMASN
ncbi:MAG: hypothetical protein ACLQUY_21775 [Ktedonobacterales bacterium]